MLTYGMDITRYTFLFFKFIFAVQIGSKFRGTYRTLSSSSLFNLLNLEGILNTVVIIMLITVKKPVRIQYAFPRSRAGHSSLLRQKWCLMRHITYKSVARPALYNLHALIPVAISNMKSPNCLFWTWRGVPLGDPSTHNNNNSLTTLLIHRRRIREQS